MTPTLTALALYSGLLGLIAAWLFANVGKVKGQEKITMGDGGNARVIRAMRGQANFIENVPLILLMLLICALIGVSAWIIHLFGIAIVVGRFCHALHFTRDDAPIWQRAAGAISSFLSLIGLSLVLIVTSLIGLF